MEKLLSKYIRQIRAKLVGKHIVNVRICWQNSKARASANCLQLNVFLKQQKLQRASSQKAMKLKGVEADSLPKHN